MKKDTFFFNLMIKYIKGKIKMQNKITYKELSKRTGISISTISRIMKGTTKVNKEKERNCL